MGDEKPSSSKIKNEDDTAMETIRKFFADKLNLATAFDDDKGTPEKVIADLSFDGLTKHWKDKGFKNIITMVGAGISTSAGIPDFRSPGSGLYDNLQKYDLPTPTAIFDIDYFKAHPQAFFDLARELYPGTFNPTPSHYFVRLLHEKGLLLRHYTQNIDTLERIAGIPEEKLVEAHGTFYSNHCLGCRKIYSMEWMKEEIFSHREPKCKKCNFLVKPDIVFFGENLPEKFYKLPTSDFEKCDLLIIMGTSLEVQPFASLIDHAGSRCVRLLINRTKVGNDHGALGAFMSGPGLMFDSSRNTRDVAYIGDCDDGVLALAEALGWSKELSELVKNDRARLGKNKERATRAGSTKRDKNSAQTDAKDMIQKVETPPRKEDDAK